MNKIRIYELAKELGVQSKDLVTAAKELNINVNNHMSTLEDADIAAIKKRFGKTEDKPETPKPRQKTSKPIQPQQASKPQAVQQTANTQQKPQTTQQTQNGRPEQKQEQRPQRQEQKKDSRPVNKPQQQHPAADKHPAAAHAKPVNRPKDISAQTEMIDEEAIQLNPKKDFKTVERIGKKPQNKTVQGRPPYKSQQQGKPYNRNFKQRGHEAPKKEEVHAPKKPIKIGDSVSVKELSEKLGKPVTEIIKKLLLLGIIATINQMLDFDTAQLICEEFGVKVDRVIDKGSEEVLLKTEDDKPEDLQSRPPVVTIMGHVDHGKTSLLDAIRQTNVIATEAGGITQHIGAYTVNIGDKKIAFLDTPGHEAFTAMRARGAKVTDIAILVVAADDGVMPQTVEAINHAKAANVALIVAINKIDKPGANPDRVKQELTEYGLLSEDWGGDTVMVPVSAKKKEGISTLLEMILLVAEMQELKANPNKKGAGTVIEAELDKGKGPVATVLIQDGSLNLGDYFIAGNTYGKVRGMIDDKGKRIKKAGPSTPVEIQGLDEVPDAGDTFMVVDDEKVARTISEKRKDKQRLTQI
ncbi:MAG: translation initiation factor IF-2, partial [Clostridiaceae bacterium]|nr:translation initiation factor IF-2 [Clostridiaceae bacterium]